jgi:hypothetical protein
MDRELIEEVENAFEMSKRFPEEDLPSGFTKLGDFGIAVMGAKRLDKINGIGNENEYEFVVWNRDQTGGFSNGHYTNDYESAKKKFLERSDLNQQYKPMRLFSTGELSLIQSCLLHSCKIPNLAFDQANQMTGLLNRIDNHTPSRKLDIGKMFDESELFLIKAGLVKAGVSPDLDNATRKGIGQIVEKIEGLEDEVLDEFVYHDDQFEDELDLGCVCQSKSLAKGPRKV